MTEQISKFNFQLTCTSKRWMKKQVTFSRALSCWTVGAALAGPIKFVPIWTKISGLPQIWPHRPLIC